MTPAPATRRVALVAGLVLVVGGAAAAGFRLPGERTSDDRGQPRSDTDDPDTSVRASGVRSRGPGLTQPGIHLLVSPEASGDLEVVERIITPEPISVLPLAVPPRLPDVGGPAARLVDLRIAADDAAVQLNGSAEVEPRRDVDLVRPATTFELRYRVLNADQQSISATPGRATLSLRPAASGALASSPTVVEVRGAVVHALVCLDAPRKRQLCGIDDRGGWHTRPVTAATSSVLALVDLPSQDA